MYPSLQLTPLDWHFQTEPSDKCCLDQNGRSKWPRGKVIGGSSVLNAMLYVRGNRRDYDRWQELGNEGKLQRLSHNNGYHCHIFCPFMYLATLKN